MGKYKLSIALTTYNSEKYIEELLRSLTSQTRPFDELIICDDCSSDETIHILEDFIDRNNLSEKVKLFFNASNVGFIENFKKCISYCSGDIIFLCDHDDVWLNNKLETIEELFSQYPNIGCLGHSFKTIDSNGNVIIKKNNPIWSNNGLIKKKIKYKVIEKIKFKDEYLYNFTPGCCVAFRGDEKNNILNKLNSAPHDYLISLYFAAQNKLYFFNDELINYRIHGDNAIGLPKVVNFESRLKLILKDYDDKKDLHQSLFNNLNRKQVHITEKILKTFLKRYNYFVEKDFLRLFILGLNHGLAFFLTILKDIKILIKNG